MAEKNVKNDMPMTLNLFVKLKKFTQRLKSIRFDLIHKLVSV